MYCDALLNKGSWLDSKFRNWQPDGMFVLQRMYYISSSLSFCWNDTARLYALQLH
jgi:hypothetical protein